ncbi:hypothetical protein BJX66DRAFT_338910 [Aspergillus keveii]|uniref:Uncharacterized protein n=1 Tax=Aspergillus keveii TaxID=714993 RepID=A0ABR4G2R3_9EURO
MADPYAAIIFRLLDDTIANANVPLGVREQATYVKVSYTTHRNTYRLMAQTSVIFNGGNVLHPSHGNQGPNGNAHLPVYRLGGVIRAIAMDHQVTPGPGDYEGHPIELLSILDPAIQNGLPGERIFDLHRYLIAMERVANEHLARLTRQYGYHYILRAGLEEYYMTKAVAEAVIFLRADRRGVAYRVRAQRACYEAMEETPTLTDQRKAEVINFVNCAPEDAHRFWNWLAANRARYHAMRECLGLMNNIQCLLGACVPPLVLTNHPT